MATGLDTVDGGPLAVNLGALYDYAVRRLSLANARNDDAILQEVQRLIEPLAQSWKSIKSGGTTSSDAVRIWHGCRLVEG